MQGLDLDHQANMYSGMVSQSRRMHDEVFTKIDRAASTDVPVLILGETGVGKELTASAIHTNSRRKNYQYVPVNCAAIPNDLIESELYGHVRGAFTSAMTNRAGKFQSADRGTLYLDEIGWMPKDQQPKLLRVLEDMVITPVGADKSYKVNVRVIAGTNQDLYKIIRDENFREDLFYRLAVVTIHIPPLRERLGDVPMLIKYFMEKYKQQYSRDLPDFTPTEYIEYMRYKWPGNVRELENAVKAVVASGLDKLAILADIKQRDALIQRGDGHAQLDKRMDGNGSITMLDLQRNAILNALERNNYNKTAAARELNIDVKTLYNHLHIMRAESELKKLSGDGSQGYSGAHNPGGNYDGGLLKNNGDNPTPLRVFDISKQAAEDVKMKIILKTLEETGWNRREAARRLNISYKALLNNLKKWQSSENGKGEQLELPNLLD